MVLRNKPEVTYPGVYRAEVVRVRYNKGVHFVKAKILSFSYQDSGNQYDWVTSWAPVASPFCGAVSEGDKRHGTWFAPLVGDQCIIAFEQGLQGRPMCVGFIPRIEDMPTEFDNDDYTAKERESEDRESPVNGDRPEVNEAAMLRTALLYVLLHQKTNHLVLDAAIGEDAPEPRLEIGENASNPDVGFEMALGRRLVHDFLNHTHGGSEVDEDSIDGPGLEEEDEDYYLSEWAWITQKPREVDKTTPEPEDDEEESSDEEVGTKIVEFAENICTVITTADDFLADPVGTLTDGVQAALEGAVNQIPEIDIDKVLAETDEFFGNLETEAKDAGIEALQGLVGADGAIGSMLGGEVSAALSGAVGSMDLGALAGFANGAYESLKGLAQDAGVLDAIDGLAAEVLGPALDQGVKAVKDSVNGAITNTLGGALDGAGLDIPFLEGALDVAAGLCGGNLADTVSGLFSLAVDGLNTLTGGALTPFTGSIKSIGSGLIAGAFAQEAEDGQSQVENGRY